MNIKEPGDRMEEYCGVFGIYELFPAFVVSCAAILAVSLATEAPSQQICREFDQAAGKL